MKEMDYFEEAFLRDVPPKLTWRQGLPVAAQIVDEIALLVSEVSFCCSENHPRAAIQSIAELCRACCNESRQWQDAHRSIPSGCMTEGGTAAESLVEYGASIITSDLADAAKAPGWLDTIHTLKPGTEYLQLRPLYFPLLVLARSAAYAITEDNRSVPWPGDHDQYRRDRSKAAAENVLPRYIELLQQGLQKKPQPQYPHLRAMISGQHYRPMKK